MRCYCNCAEPATASGILLNSRFSKLPVRTTSLFIIRSATAYQHHAYSLSAMAHCRRCSLFQARLLDIFGKGYACRLIAGLASQPLRLVVSPSLVMQPCALSKIRRCSGHDRADYEPFEITTVAVDLFDATILITSV